MCKQLFQAFVYLLIWVHVLWLLVWVFWGHMFCCCYCFAFSLNGINSTKSLLLQFSFHILEGFLPLRIIIELLYFPCSVLSLYFYIYIFDLLESFLLYRIREFSLIPFQTANQLIQLTLIVLF